MKRIAKEIKFCGSHEEEQSSVQASVCKAGVGYSVSSTCWMARRISATVQGLVRHGTAL